MKIFLAIPALILAAACGTALAGEGNEHGEGAMGMSCDKMDMGKPGTEEHRGKMGEMFAKIDTDKDGLISRAEFDHHHEQMMAGKEDRQRKHNHVEEHK